MSYRLSVINDRLYRNTNKKRASATKKFHNQADWMHKHTVTTFGLKGDQCTFHLILEKV